MVRVAVVASCLLLIFGIVIAEDDSCGVSCKCSSENEMYCIGMPLLWRDMPAIQR